MTVTIISEFISESATAELTAAAKSVSDLASPSDPVACCGGSGTGRRRIRVHCPGGALEVWPWTSVLNSLVV